MTTQLVRLTPEVYKALEAKFSRPIVTENTTAHQAGFQLGVYAVLQALRNGFVVDQP
jgi:hypothetical protein